MMSKEEKNKDKVTVEQQTTSEFEEAVDELKELLLFKNETKTGDIVFILIEEMGGGMWGLVKNITPVKNGDKELKVSISILNVPILNQIWPINKNQLCGEIYTVDGKKRFIKALRFTKDFDKLTEEQKLQFVPSNNTVH